jgi:hypothetical protein
MRSLILFSFLFVFSFLGSTQQIANLQWFDLSKKYTAIQEQSLCSFEQNDLQYQLKLELSGFKLEEWLPILEITDPDNGKTKSTLINLGPGKRGERLRIAAARFSNGWIYFTAIGQVAIGKPFFYSGKLNTDGELKGDLTEIQVPLNIPKNKGIPYVFSSSEGGKNTPYTVLAFLPGEDFSELNQLTFLQAKNPEIGLAILSDRMELVDSRKITFDIASEVFKITNCLIAKEGDIVFITNTGNDKKALSYLFHTHIFKLNQVSKEKLEHHPIYNKQMVFAENPQVFAFAYSTQASSSDKPYIKIHVFEKGGFSKFKEMEVPVEKSELSLSRPQRNFDLKSMVLHPDGLVLLGSFYELKPQKKNKAAFDKFENYYLCVQQSINGSAIVHSIPVFCEYGWFSPGYELGSSQLKMIFNQHQKTVIGQENSHQMLLQKDVAKKAKFTALTIQFSNAKMEHQVLVQSTEKLRLLSASAKQEKGGFLIEAIDKSTANTFKKNILKLAQINFNL